MLEAPVRNGIVSLPLRLPTVLSASAAAMAPPPLCRSDDVALIPPPPPPPPSALPRCLTRSPARPGLLGAAARWPPGARAAVFVALGFIWTIFQAVSALHGPILAVQWFMNMLY